MTASRSRALVKSFLDALNAANHDAALAMLGEDVVHDTHDGRKIGKDEFRWFLGMASRNFRETISDVAIMVDEGGGRAAAEFTARGVYLSTVEGLPAADGQSYALREGMFFEIDDGLITRVTVCRDHAELKRQLGDG
ncbi:MAG: nuclear transport factor 2 family protein [Brucellaceae bacterium]|nr:nuclear transport factor 2 family protein [Brucellaceae bacterium]